MRRLVLIASALTLAAAPLAAQSSAAPALPPLTPAAIRADLAVARTQFLGWDKSYAPAARAEAEQRLARLESAADTLQRAWLELELARIAALADNGHTGVVVSRWSTRFNRVGVRFTLFGDDFWILAAHTEHADLLGARLAGVNGHSVAELRTIARSLRGGVPAFRDRFAPYLYESPELLHALGVSAAAEAAEYELILPSGARVTRRLVGDPADTVRVRPQTHRWMYPEPPPPDGHEWKSLLAADKAPWALQEVATPFRVRVVPELDAVEAEFRMNNSPPGRSIESFIKDVQALVRERMPTNFILDMRHNGGGNLNTTREFARQLVRDIPGHIFVLTSPGTFSAAISTVGYLKQAGGEKVSIVGEAVGDRLEFWAEGRPLTLPNSQVVISLATERHDYANGCKAYTDCHNAVVRQPISVPTLAPDIHAPWTMAAYVAGRDPAMEAVAAALRK